MSASDVRMTDINVRSALIRVRWIGYNPRIHALYFCPQLFRHESGKLVPLEGEEIGQLIARAVEASATERRPWYEPMEKLPREPLINSAMLANSTLS
jgi:hypothetical protein